MFLGTTLNHLKDTFEINIKAMIEIMVNSIKGLKEILLVIKSIVYGHDG